MHAQFGMLRNVGKLQVSSNIHATISPLSVLGILIFLHVPSTQLSLDLQTSEALAAVHGFFFNCLTMRSRLSLPLSSYKTGKCCTTCNIERDLWGRLFYAMNSSRTYHIAPEVLGWHCRENSNFCEYPLERTNVVGHDSFITHPKLQLQLVVE